MAVTPDRLSDDNTTAAAASAGHKRAASPAPCEVIDKATERSRKRSRHDREPVERGKARRAERERKRLESEAREAPGRDRHAGREARQEDDRRAAAAPRVGESEQRGSVKPEPPDPVPVRGAGERPKHTPIKFEPRPAARTGSASLSAPKAEPERAVVAQKPEPPREQAVERNDTPRTAVERPSLVDAIEKAELKRGRMASRDEPARAAVERTEAEVLLRVMKQQQVVPPPEGGNSLPLSGATATQMMPTQQSAAAGNASRWLMLMRLSVLAGDVSRLPSCPPTCGAPPQALPARP